VDLDRSCAKAVTMVIRGLSTSRQRILDAARGIFLLSDDDKLTSKRRILRYFPLRERNFRKQSPTVGIGQHSSCCTTPADFHAALVSKIAAAEKRVYLASLYIGPAANPATSVKEAELLQALQTTAAPDVKILLDKNRALRPVPVFNTDNEQTKVTISSAEACYRVLQSNLSLRQKSQLLLSNDGKINQVPSGGVFLLTVLPTWQQLYLQNPYNEVAGVFHLKCYIVDDDLILTGANLSEEYFSDRTDRYLWLTSASPSSDDAGRHGSEECDSKHDSNDNLVECYAALVEALCQHAEPYTSSEALVESSHAPRTTRQELLDSLVEILTVDADSSASDIPTVGASLMRSETKQLGHASEVATVADGDTTCDAVSDHDCEAQSVKEPEPVVAYAVPTFQAPPYFFRGLVNPIPPDTAIIANLIETVAAHTTTDENGSSSCEIRLASAYLNLTDEMIGSMEKCRNTSIHLLTAGSISHGFKPNPAKVGNKGQPWIPAVFDALGRQGVSALQERQRDASTNRNSMTHLWYYQRQGWTFHAKGIWFTTTNAAPKGGMSEEDTAKDGFSGHNIRIMDASSLCAVTHGSGNYGCRSAVCDMESNLILILLNGSTPQASSAVKTMFQNDWNQMCDHAAPAEREEQQPLAAKLRILLPFIRPFF
jgi:CDP-diacylglycerol---glycerol-3-phosphate 3-phosphatidyltransferase